MRSSPHTHIHTHTHTHKHAHTHTHTQTHTQKHTHTHTHTQENTHTHTHKHKCTQINTHQHMQRGVWVEGRSNSWTGRWKFKQLPQCLYGGFWNPADPPGQLTLSSHTHTHTLLHRYSLQWSQYIVDVCRDGDTQC